MLSVGTGPQHFGMAQAPRPGSSAAFTLEETPGNGERIFLQLDRSFPLPSACEEPSDLRDTARSSASKTSSQFTSYLNRPGFPGDSGVSWV